MKRRDLLVGMGALALLPPGMAKAADGTILKLSGDFGKAGPDGTLSLSLADLDAMPQTRFTTTTPWHSGSVEFSGVSLADLLKAADAAPSSGKLQLIALNDYLVDADLAELVDGGALLATRADGQPMAISDKGPIFVVFPYDSRADLRHQSYYSRSVWQLAEIDLSR